MDISLPTGGKVTIPDDPSPEQISYVHQLLATQPPTEAPSPEPSFSHKLGVLLSGVPKGFANTALMVGAGASASDDMLHAHDTAQKEKADDKFLSDASEKVSSIGASPTPGNAQEKYADVIGQGFGALPLGGPVKATGGAIARALLSSALGSVGGQVAADKLGDGPIQRILGALVSQTPLAATKALSGNAATLARKGMQGISEDQLTTAGQNLKDAAEVGQPLTIAQAIPGGSNLDKIQDALVNSSFAPKTTAILREQPSGLMSKIQGWTNKLPGQITSPRAVSNQAQDTATAAIANGYKEAGQAWRAVADPSATISHEEVSPFLEHLDNLIKTNESPNVRTMAQDVRDAIKNPDKAPELVKSGLVDAKGNPLTPDPVEPPNVTTDPFYLKNAVDESLNGFGQRRLSTDSVGATEARGAALIRQSLRGTLAKSNAKSIPEANAAYESIIDSKVNPLKKSATGDISGRIGALEDLNAPSKILPILNKGTIPGGQSDILTLEKDFRPEDPTAFPNAVKTNFANNVAAVSVDKGGAANPKFASDLYDRIFGDAVQKQGLKEQLIGVARASGKPDDALYPGFFKLMGVLRQASKLPSSISGISTGEVNALSSGNLSSSLLRVFGFMPIEKGAKFVDEFYRKNAFEHIDHLMSSPDGLELLQKLAKTDPLSETGQNYIQSYLATVPQSKGQGK